MSISGQCAHHMLAPVCSGGLSAAFGAFLAGSRLGSSDRSWVGSSRLRREDADFPLLERSCSALSRGEIYTSEGVSP
jgi:hypothetical protein